MQHVARAAYFVTRFADGEPGFGSDQPRKLFLPFFQQLPRFIEHRKALVTGLLHPGGKPRRNGCFSIPARRERYGAGQPAVVRTADFQHLRSINGLPGDVSC